MLLFKTVNRSVSAISRIFVLLAVVLSSSGCGFSPIYAQKGDNAEVAAKLSSVQVKPIKTLMGQEYVTSLEDTLDPARTGASKEYLLEADLNKTVTPLAIERDTTVTRYKVEIIVTYKLKEISTGKIVSSGTVKGESDYDRVESDYATYVSETDTTTHAIKELAKDTKIRIIGALLK